MYPAVLYDILKIVLFQKLTGLQKNSINIKFDLRKHDSDNVIF